MWPFVRHGDEGETASDGRRMMNAIQRTITAIAAVGIPVTDQDRVLQALHRELAMETPPTSPCLSSPACCRMLALGSTTTLALIPAHDGVPAGVETGIRLASPDAAAAHQHLGERGVDVGELLQWEGVPAMFAVRDPDHNGLEITQEESRS